MKTTNYKTKVLYLMTAIMICFAASVTGCGNQSNSQNSAETLLKELRQGNYAGLEDKMVQRDLEGILSRQNPEVEWISFDLNGDGENELILQEKKYVSDNLMKRLVGAFAAQDGKVSAVIWDVNDMAEFFSLCDGQLIYFSHYYGTYDSESYSIYEYDAQWDRKLLEVYTYLKIDSMDELPSDWTERYPDYTQPGTYYRKCSVDDVVDGKIMGTYQDLTAQQWSDELGIARFQD